MLGISIGLNAVSTHGACTAVFVAVAAITVFCFASIRTLGRITILAWVGLAAIVVASTYFLLDGVIMSNMRSLDCNHRCWRAGPS